MSYVRSNQRLCSRHDRSMVFCLKSIGAHTLFSPSAVEYRTEFHCSRCFWARYPPSLQHAIQTTSPNDFVQQARLRPGLGAVVRQPRIRAGVVRLLAVLFSLGPARQDRCDSPSDCCLLYCRDKALFTLRMLGPDLMGIRNQKPRREKWLYASFPLNRTPSPRSFEKMLLNSRRAGRWFFAFATQGTLSRSLLGSDTQ